MKGDMITLYHPGDGVTKDSNSTTYKGIKEFKTNGNGTISFKTKKHGTVTTPLYWRLKEDVELGEEDQAPAPAAGNRNRGW
jgi:hypothetical protein